MKEDRDTPEHFAVGMLLFEFSFCSQIFLVIIRKLKIKHFFIILNIIDFLTVIIITIIINVLQNGSFENVVSDYLIYLHFV